MTPLLALALASSLWAQEPSASVPAVPPGFVLTAETRHFSFYARAGEKVDAERSERYLMEVQALLGAPLIGRAEYFRYRSPEELAAFTGLYAAGVTFTRERQIHSTESFHRHEIVHLVASQLGDPGPFFHEGLAVALSHGGRWRGKRLDEAARSHGRGLSLTQIAGQFAATEPDVAYPVAGSFVASLVRRHGIARMAAFFRACTPGGMDREAAFRQIFGSSLDAAAVAWAGGQPVR